MNTLFFDIETIPSPEDQKEIHIEILKKKHKGKTDIEIHESTSFEGTFGRICCIAVIKEVNGKEVLKETFSGDEKEVLTKFWEVSKDVHRFVGHNIWAFDLPFIYQRSIINRIKTRTDISFARYRNIPIYDTMLEWTLWNFDNGKIQKLDTMAKVLGLPTSKDEMDGSMVWPYYQEGKIEDICRYCMKDVELTRSVYKKMTFDDLEEDTTINF
ncbi:MAG TPA: ribonuclease H-like domain-containing protein [Patescibacteria group bacterium]|nr:ribonuclease H-like domain-containing protein [Patescibacteria group bacterium]